MHPLTTFPILLDFGLISPFLLRIAVSLFILYIGFERYKKPYKWTSIIYIISGILLLIGLYTQIASIIGILVVSFDFWANKKTTEPTKERFILYAIVKIILISLIFTGAGFLAFDLPL